MLAFLCCMCRYCLRGIPNLHHVPGEWRLGSQSCCEGPCLLPSSLSRSPPCAPPQPSPLVDVVVLEGLGPPPELEDLPYGYQRKTLAAPGPRRPDQGQGAVGLVVQQAGGAGAAAAGAAGGHGSLSAADHHVHFREQVGGGEGLGSDVVAW